MISENDDSESSRGQYSKPWEELDITDNFLFCKIMSKPEFCKEMIERILGFKVKSLSIVGGEKQYTGTYLSHGIRLDVAAENAKDVYDIEFQSVKYPDLPKRMRFYQGTLDIDSLSHSKSYEELRETWIVFICDFDMFALGESGYQVRMSLDSLEGKSVSETYEDGTHKIFINLKACDKIKEERLRNFLMYLKTKKPQDRFTEKIDKAVDYNRHNAEWRKEYMTVAWQIEYEKSLARKEARAAGLAEGRAEGLAEGREAGLAEGREAGLAEGEKLGTEKAYMKLIKQGLLTVQQSAEQLGISEDEVRKMME